MAKKRLVPILAILFVMFIWGLSFLSIKVSVTVFPPMSLALSRFIMASVILFTLLKIREPGSVLKKSDIPRIAVSGIIGITVYFFFENNGVKMTSASTASIIIGTIPVLTVIADYLFCGNKITLPKAVGVVLSFIGVYLIVMKSGQLSLSSGYLTGNLMIGGAALAWVAYSLLTRPLNKNNSLLAITTYQTLFGTLAILPFALFEHMRWSQINGTILANVAFLGIFCSALGYYMYIFAIRELGVDLSALFINLIPVVTVISSYFILGEKITTAQLTGGGIIVAAVYLADFNSWFRKGEAGETASEEDKICS